MSDLYLAKEQQLFCAAMRENFPSSFGQLTNDEIIFLCHERYAGWQMAKESIFGDDEMWLDKANAARERGFVGDPDK